MQRHRDRESNSQPLYCKSDTLPLCHHTILCHFACPVFTSSHRQHHWQLVNYLLQELLKSHLMFAVHEEIEQLKEQIATLTDRNTLLEHENAVLKTRASPETLALLRGNPQT